MPVRIQVGALPGSTVAARLTRIAPKAREKEGATVFDVELADRDRRLPGDAARRLLGERRRGDPGEERRAPCFRRPSPSPGQATVEVPLAEPGGEPEKKAIEVGLSDGLNMEIVAGLAEGDKVVQRPPKEIK